MSFRPAARQFFEASGVAPTYGVNYVECLNNTSCLCHTDMISTFDSNYSFSVWADIAQDQPSLTEGRTVCFTGRRQTASGNTYGIELGYTKRNSTHKLLGAFVQGSGIGPNETAYTQYLGTWHNLTVTYSPGTVRTYVDGVLKNTNGGTQYLLVNAILGLCCLNWFDNMISGGPIGRYANMAFWSKELTTSEVSAISGSITTVPDDADHRYDMQIVSGQIPDIGVVGGWDFTHVSDFQNGVYNPSVE